jgi:hypothetical protein
MHRQFLISQISEQRAKLAELDRQSLQEAERSTVGPSIAKLEASETNGVVALPNAGYRLNEYCKSAALWLC